MGKFGHTTVDSVGSFNAIDTILFSRFQANGNGRAISISANGWTDETSTAKAAIYDDALNFIAETMEITVTGAGWQVFPFASEVKIRSGTWYYLAVWGTGPAIMIGVSNVAVNLFRDFEAYGVFPDPLVKESAHNYEALIYCSYGHPRRFVFHVGL